MTAASHPNDTFCFAELLTPDAAAAARFYSALFGWTLAPVAGGYSMFRLGGRDVAGVRHWDRGTHWVAYVRVADLDATAARAVAQGGRLFSAAADTLSVARTCLIADPEGAIFGLWEPRGIDGTAVETGAGSLWWIELATANLQACRGFYESLFGWTTVHTTRFENGPHGYLLFKSPALPDRSTAGAFQFEPEWGLEPTWQVYVEVASFDATAARACELGGQQGFWRDAPNAGRIGVIVDPAEAAFLIAQPLAGATSSASGA